jgi:hypothetical protein
MDYTFALYLSSEQCYTSELCSEQPGANLKCSIFWGVPEIFHANAGLTL